MPELSAFEAHLASTTGSTHTVRRYLADVRAFLSFLDGRPLSVGEVELYVSKLNHGKRKPQSVAVHLSAIRRYIGFEAVHGSEAAAKTLELLAAYKVSPPVRQKDRRQVRALEPEEFVRLMSVQICPTTRALLQFLWWSGARVSEAIGDPVAGIPPLTVLDGILLWRVGYTRQIGKGGKVRTLILPKEGRCALEDRLFRVLEGGGSSAGGIVGRLAETILFSSTRGRPLTKQSVNRSLHLAAGKAGVRQIGAHSLRHSFKARLRQAGVQPEIIRALMGHGPKSVTDLYGRAEVAELLEAAEKIAEGQG